jgi:hypothetical protein
MNLPAAQVSGISASPGQAVGYQSIDIVDSIAASCGELGPKKD